MRSKPFLSLVFGSLLLAGLSAVALASEHPAPAKEEIREPHPEVPHDAAWAGKLLAGIAVLFAVAIPIGLLARSVLVEGRMETAPAPDAHGHGHDDHGHGHGH